ncbi:MAG TPA: hypothetical protein VH916_13650 [Dehalococcoidia bacterium]|jgi:hypothetical protein
MPALAILLVLAAVARPVHAQSIALADLQNAALSTDDLPAGFSEMTEQQPNLPSFFDLGFLRSFVNSGTHEFLAVGLVVLSPNRPAGTIPADALGAQFLQGLTNAIASSTGLAVSDLSMTGPLGIGDVDISGQLDATNSAAGLALQFYADLSQQGQLWVVVIYGAPAGSADMSYLYDYARQQQQKIADANLGGGSQ